MFAVLIVANQLREPAVLIIKAVRDRSRPIPTYLFRANVQSSAKVYGPPEHTF